MKQKKEAEKVKKEAEDAERMSAVEEARRAESERRAAEAAKRCVLNPYTRKHGLVCACFVLNPCVCVCHDTHTTRVKVEFIHRQGLLHPAGSDCVMTQVTFSSFLFLSLFP